MEAEKIAIRVARSAGLYLESVSPVRIKVSLPETKVTNDTGLKISGRPVYFKPSSQRNQLRPHPKTLDK
jgi:hypothetical protein